MQKDLEEHLARLRAQDQRVRAQPEIERNPDYFQRRAEHDGRSTWSGGSFGGGTFACRSRGEGEQP
jgi:hypothetical protein